MYKYKSPHTWLGARISLARDEDDTGWLVAALYTVAQLLDGDQIQECFEAEMGMDGYFGKPMEEVRLYKRGSILVLRYSSATSIVQQADFTPRSPWHSNWLRRRPIDEALDIATGSYGYQLGEECENLTS